MHSTIHKTCIVVCPLRRYYSLHNHIPTNPLLLTSTEQTLAINGYHYMGDSILMLGAGGTENIRGYDFWFKYFCPLP